ncbi:MAG: hypothetical protein K6G66_08925 [Oscillospiraceae bacterium]|jgi:hypothetical protein|nr:hypothetical protein [Oscillospiraceae bacterium]
MGIISGLIKNGLKIGALITAYQASQKTKRETGSLIGETFWRNFMGQAIENIMFLVGAVKKQSSRNKRR